MNSREKGKRAERELAHKLSDWGFDCRRGQQFSGIEGEDVIGLPFIHIECKAVERLDLIGAMEQSKRDAREDQVPTVMHKKNRKPWLITMELDEFKPFYRAYIKEWME